MIGDSNTDTGKITLAFSLSAIERLEDPNAVFDDAEDWSRSIGLIDDDTERIERIVTDHDLQQDFEIQDRDKWFALEEISEAMATPRNVYVGASDQDMRVSTMFDWEYVAVTEAAEKANWDLSEPPSEPGTVTRLLTFLRGLIK